MKTLENLYKVYSIVVGWCEKGGRLVVSYELEWDGKDRGVMEIGHDEDEQYSCWQQASVDNDHCTIHSVERNKKAWDGDYVDR